MDAAKLKEAMLMDEKLARIGLDDLDPTKEGPYNPGDTSFAWSERMPGEWFRIPRIKVIDMPHGTRSLKERIKFTNKRFKGRKEFRGFTVPGNGDYIIVRVR